MSKIDEVLSANRAAVDELMAAAENCAAVWKVPRAPGKWSPSQVVEHVARSLEESAHEAAGVPSKFPTFPGFLRPLVRVFFFKRVLKNEGFPKARTTRAMNPESGPATPAEGRARIDSALASFDRACRELVAARASVSSGLFGAVSVEDYARFQELHTRHHRKQIPQAAPTDARGVV